MTRTQYCGLFDESYVGKQVNAMGWVQTKRDMGGVLFLDVKDREGALQVVCNAALLPAEQFALAERLKNQSVVQVSGTIFIREEETYNPLLKTGTIELRAEDLTLLSSADTLPYALEEEGSVREDLRLQYRYLDLRRQHMADNLRFRHRVASAARSFLDHAGFIEVETPMLTKSTPEGARDYLVPSRVHPGSFYALPQSPQIFKQLLMVGGLDRYYQVARCFRDEDLRADRQPEFTQVDMELSFVEQEDVLQHLEHLFGFIFQEVMGKELEGGFPRITWREAMDRYGSDKPDIRFELPIVDVTDLAARCSFSVFRGAAESGGLVRAINVKGGASFARSTIEELTARALHYGAKGMAWIAVRENGEIYSILTKYFTDEEMKTLLDKMEAKPGDFILFCADTFEVVCRTLGALRLDLADMLGLREKGKYRFLFVTEFPQFEYSEREGRFLAMHHPFTMPFEEDLPYLLTDPARVRAQAYDVVLNGIELGSGSIRIHRRDVQEKMFEALGFEAKEIEERFGFLVNAFRFGTPPHGGFAFGLDRLTMLLLGESSLREVIAFPKTKDASCPLTNAPDSVDASQLEILHLDGIGRATAKQKSAPNRVEVAKIAALARLKLGRGEVENAARQMEDMVAFANRLQKAEVDNVPPTNHVVDIFNVFHEDIPAKAFDRALLLQNAPTKEDGYFTVPNVME